MGMDGKVLFDRVMEQLRRSNLPRTGYMVTLLLWALHQDKQFDRINEATLLTNVVDHLIGKADFTQALHRKFDPTSKEITLQHLAYHIREAGGVVNRNDALRILIDFFASKALNYNADTVLHLFIDCGILSEQDDQIFFKFRCFEEYFYAHLLRADAGRLSSLLEGRRFCSYPRELELLAGLRRQNADLLQISI